MRGSTQSAAFLLAPGALLVGLLLLCTFAMVRLSLGTQDAEWSAWSLASYAELADPYFRNILLDTIWLAFLSAVLTTAIAFPIALFMVRTRSNGLRRLVLICIMLPMLVSLLVQSFGWIAILGPDGLLNQIVQWLLGEERSVTLLFNRTGVLLGLIQTALPLAVLPIVSSLGSIPTSLEEAASVLGAPRHAVYREVILPLSWPGIASGMILVFGFNTGAFVVPLLLGGLKVTTLAIVIRDQMGTLLNWPLGSALSVVLIAFALGVQAVQRLIAGRLLEGSRNHG